MVIVLLYVGPSYLTGRHQWVHIIGFCPIRCTSGKYPGASPIFNIVTGQVPLKESVI